VLLTALDDGLHTFVDRAVGSATKVKAPLRPPEKATRRRRRIASSVGPARAADGRR
jgi:hypothetical protein